jgi:hypothetical protein
VFSGLALWRVGVLDHPLYELLLFMAALLLAYSGSR